MDMGFLAEGASVSDTALDELLKNSPQAEPLQANRQIGEYGFGNVGFDDGARSSSAACVRINPIRTCRRALDFAE
jgi:hypothetical protein